MRNDASRQSLSHDPAKAIPFVLHSITTTSSASLPSHQQLPHLSLPPLTRLPPHPSFPSPVSFLRLLLSFACFPSPIAFLARLLPHMSLALPVPCLACLLPHPYLSSPVAFLCPSLASPISYLTRLFPCLSLASPASSHMLPLSLAHHFPLPIACLACLLPHPSLPTCVTSHSNDPPLPV